jgi:hypothetical protein
MKKLYVFAYLLVNYEEIVEKLLIFCLFLQKNSFIVVFYFSK